jgi:hypothetical protein
VRTKVSSRNLFQEFRQVTRPQISVVAFNHRFKRSSQIRCRIAFDTLRHHRVAEHLPYHLQQPVGQIQCVAILHLLDDGQHFRAFNRRNGPG